jgi:dihydrodipicolinate synthase/N-acetylneuraminate lyase
MMRTVPIVARWRPRGANLIPAFHRQLFEAAMNGRLAVARHAHSALLPLISALYTGQRRGAEVRPTGLGTAQ